MLVGFFGGFLSRSALTPGEDNEEASLLGYPPIGLWDGRMIEHAEEKRKQPYILFIFYSRVSNIRAIPDRKSSN